MKRYPLLVSKIGCVFAVLMSLAGCEEQPPSTDVDCNNQDKTQEQSETRSCLWDMGEPTDRSKNRGF